MQVQGLGTSNTGAAFLSAVLDLQPLLMNDNNRDSHVHLLFMTRAQHL